MAKSSDPVDWDDSRLAEIREVESGAGVRKWAIQFPDGRFYQSLRDVHYLNPKLNLATLYDSPEAAGEGVTILLGLSWWLVGVDE